MPGRDGDLPGAERNGKAHDAVCATSAVQPASSSHPPPSRFARHAMTVNTITITTLMAQTAVPLSRKPWLVCNTAVPRNCWSRGCVGTGRAGKISEQPCDQRWDHVCLPVWHCPGSKRPALAIMRACMLAWLKKQKPKRPAWVADAALSLRPC